MTVGSNPNNRPGDAFARRLQIRAGRSDDNFGTGFQLLNQADSILPESRSERRSVRRET
jgi:hypothetical protein